MDLLANFLGGIFRNRTTGKAKELGTAVARIDFDRPPQAPVASGQQPTYLDHILDVLCRQDLSGMSVNIDSEKWKVGLAYTPGNTPQQPLQVSIYGTPPNAIGRYFPGLGTFGNDQFPRPVVLLFMLCTAPAEIFFPAAAIAQPLQ